MSLILKNSDPFLRGNMDKPVVFSDLTLHLLEFRALTICPLLIYFVSAVGSYCLDYAVGAATDQNQLQSVHTILNTYLLPSSILPHEFK